MACLYHVAAWDCLSHPRPLTEPGVCLRCSGCGYLPRAYDPHATYFSPLRCDWCHGTGRKEP